MSDSAAFEMVLRTDRDGPRIRTRAFGLCCLAVLCAVATAVLITLGESQAHWPSPPAVQHTFQPNLRSDRSAPKQQHTAASSQAGVTAALDDGSQPAPPLRSDRATEVSVLPEIDDPAAVAGPEFLDGRSRTAAAVARDQPNGYDPLPPGQQLLMYLPPPAVNLSNPTPAQCRSLFDAEGCRWALGPYACPSQPSELRSDHSNSLHKFVPVKGVAGDDGSTGFVCCCGAAAGWQRRDATGRDVRDEPEPIRLRKLTVAEVDAAVLPSLQLWESREALAVLRHATFPGAFPPSWPRAKRVAAAVTLDSRVSVVQWGSDGRFSRLITRGYCGLLRRIDEPTTTCDANSSTKMPWYEHTGRFANGFSFIVRARLATTQQSLSRVALQLPKGPGRQALHALLYAHDIGLHELFDSIRAQRAAQPAPWLAYTVPAEEWRHSTIKAIVTPYELYTNFTNWTATITTPLTDSERAGVLLWRGARKWHPVRSRVINLSEEARGLPKDYGLENHRGPTPENATLPWLDARDTWCSPACRRDKIEPIVQGSEYRYLLDLPGISGTTWDSLNWKMASGALVFKLVTDTVNWWHPFLTPSEDYLPVHANLSNLYDQYMWAEAHLRDAQRIATRGRLKALYFGRQDVQDAYHNQLLNRMNEPAVDVFAHFPLGFPPVPWA